MMELGRLICFCSNSEKASVVCALLEKRGNLNGHRVPDDKSPTHSAERDNRQSRRL